MSEDKEFEQVILRDIKSEFPIHQPIHNWPSVQFYERCIMYYLLNDENDSGLGFSFYAVILDRSNEDINECYADCIIRGWASFEGVRHLFYGDAQTDNEGYHYYPDLSMITLAIDTLMKLEENYCRNK